MDYNYEINKLKNDIPSNLYFIYGPEDYLRNLYLNELKIACVGSDDAFGYYQYDDFPDDKVISNSINTLPFISDRTFIEIKNASVNKLSESIVDILRNIPDYCTVAISCASDYNPDKRLKVIKFLIDSSYVLNFEAQDSSKLSKWIKRRFSAAGKNITSDAIDQLIFISGNLMNSLIPEIDKISSYSENETVTAEDVNAVANHIPEYDAFSLVNLVSQKKYNDALSLLSELLNQKNMEPIVLISALAYEYRQLFAAKIGVFNNGNDYRSKLMRKTSGNFTINQLRYAVNLCAEMEFNMKNSLFQASDILINTVVKLIAQEA